MFGQTQRFQDILHGKPLPATPLLNTALNRDVAGAWLQGEGRWGLMQDSSKNKRHARIQSLGASAMKPNCWRRGRWGGLDYRTQAPEGNGVKTDSNYTPASAFTVATIWNPIDITGVTFHPLVDQWNEGGGGRSWAVMYFGSDQKVYAYTSSNGANFHVYSSSTTLATDQYHTVVVRYGGSGVATKINLDGGANVAVDGGGNEGNNGIQAFSQPIYFGHSLQFAGGQVGSNGLHCGTIIDNRLWSDDEAQTFHFDRYRNWPRENTELWSMAFTAAATFRSKIIAY